MRPQTILAAFAVAFAFAPSLASQAVRLPDSWEWTGLPSDPADFPDKIKATGSLAILYHRAGCPSDGGYPAVAYDALVKAAETDFAVKYKVTLDHGPRLKKGRETGGEICPSELPRFEALLARWLREEWEAGLLDLDKLDWEETVGGAIIASEYLAHGRDPATYRLLRSIARDPEVDYLRRFAAQSMVGY